MERVRRASCVAAKQPEKKNEVPIEGAESEGSGRVGVMGVLVYFLPSEVV